MFWLPEELCCLCVMMCAYTVSDFMEDISISEHYPLVLSAHLPLTLTLSLSLPFLPLSLSLSSPPLSP